MSSKHSTAIALAAGLLPTIAYAQDEPTISSRLTSVVVSVLPFLVIAIIIYFWLRRVQSGPRAKMYDAYRERHMEHMVKVELSLERIAQALEKKQ